MKLILKGCAVLYVVMAFVFGAAMARTIPAVNVVGAAYYGLLWPIWPLETVLGVNIVPIPTWAFSFDDTGERA